MESGDGPVPQATLAVYAPGVAGSTSRKSSHISSRIKGGIAWMDGWLAGTSILATSILIYTNHTFVKLVHIRQILSARIYSENHANISNKLIFLKLCKHYVIFDLWSKCQKLVRSGGTQTGTQQGYVALINHLQLPQSVLIVF